MNGMSMYDYSPTEFTDELICIRVGDSIEGRVDGKVFSFTKVHEEGLSKNRWSTTTEVVSRDPEGRFWRFEYEDPATESQSRDDWDIVHPDSYVEVEKRTKEVTTYVIKA